jgi:hypothetical protein
VANSGGWPDPMDMIIVRYNGIRTVSLTCDCGWQSRWSATPVHLTTLIAQAEEHVREGHADPTCDTRTGPDRCPACGEPLYSPAETEAHNRQVHNVGPVATTSWGAEP